METKYYYEVNEYVGVHTNGGELKDSYEFTFTKITYLPPNELRTKHPLDRQKTHRPSAK
jgi:hypothetical protein